MESQSRNYPERSQPVFKKDALRKIVVFAIWCLVMIAIAGIAISVRGML